MSRVISHPVLAHSKTLEVFLSATEEQFVAHKASSPSPKTEEAPATQTGTAAASAFFSSVLNTVSHMATNLTTEVLVLIFLFGTHNNKEVDATFVEKEDYLNLLREKLEQVLNTTELHIQRSTDCVEQTVCYIS